MGKRMVGHKGNGRAKKMEGGDRVVGERRRGKDVKVCERGGGGKES